MTAARGWLPAGSTAPLASRPWMRPCGSRCWKGSSCQRLSTAAASIRCSGPRPRSSHTHAHPPVPPPAPPQRPPEPSTPTPSTSERPSPPADDPGAQGRRPRPEREGPGGHAPGDGAQRPPGPGAPALTQSRPSAVPGLALAEARCRRPEQPGSAVRTRCVPRPPRAGPLTLLGGATKGPQRRTNPGGWSSDPTDVPCGAENLPRPDLAPLLQPPPPGGLGRAERPPGVTAQAPSGHSWVG